MPILLIDNNDSFTYNLYQQMERLGAKVDVYKCDALSVDAIDRYDAIVISPGPQTPTQAPGTCEVIRQYHTRKPILGVCLGHQCIAAVFGSRIVRAPVAVHGKTTEIIHTGVGIFENVPNPMRAARYHSLIVEALPEGFEWTAWTADGLIMGMQHKQYPLFGVQFHPESFLTEAGDILITNFIHGNY